MVAGPASRRVDHCEHGPIGRSTRLHPSRSIERTLALLNLSPVVPCSAIERRRMLSVFCGEGDSRGSNVHGLPLNLCCLFVPGLVEGPLLIGICRSAHVPRICMEESVVAEAVPKGPRYGLDIAQRARLRLRNGLEFIVLVLAGNKVGRHAPPSPGIVRQILAELG